jgi:hypothetical protein
MKSRRIRWVRHVKCTGEIKNSYNSLVQELEGKRPFGR